MLRVPTLVYSNKKQTKHVKDGETIPTSTNQTMLTPLFLEQKKQLDEKKNVVRVPLSSDEMKQAWLRRDPP